MSDYEKNINIFDLKYKKTGSSIKNEICDSESEKTISPNNSLVTEVEISDAESNTSIEEIETDVENDNIDSFTCEADVAAYFFKCSNCKRYMIPYEEHKLCEDAFTDDSIDKYITDEPSQNNDICITCETSHKQLLENEDINTKYSTDED